MKKIAVFGANGATGRSLVGQAVARGYRVRAVDMTLPDASDLPEDIDRRAANVLEDDLTPVVEGCDAIVSCIGLPLNARTAFDPPPLYTGSVRSYLAAMEATGIRRLIVISASFVETRDRGPLLFRAAATVALEPIFSQMGEMEQILRRSDVDWTAVRPGWLMEGQPTGEAVVTPDVIADGLIRTRHGDLAAFMLDCLDDPTWIHRTPAIARAEDRRAESSLTLLKSATW